MAEVWVPTDHARAVFASSGVDPGKLRVVPEPVDTEEFDPTKHRPLPLPLGTRVFGPAWPHVRTAAAAAAGGGGSATEAPFVFLSIFKWEARKVSGHGPCHTHAWRSEPSPATLDSRLPSACDVCARCMQGWDILLRAFLTAFTADDNVLLLLHTQPFHSDANFAAQMQARSVGHIMQHAGLLMHHCCMHAATNARMRRPWRRRGHSVSCPRRRKTCAVCPRCMCWETTARSDTSPACSGQQTASYCPRGEPCRAPLRAGRCRRAAMQHADPRVLPRHAACRGEGWGLPIVEAMAMGLPVIATNHSGPTAYLDSTVGYPLPIEGLVEAHGGGAFEGHRWAQPSTQHLVALMRHVTDAAHRAEAAARGRAARRRMQERYGPEVVAQAVAAQLRRIERQLAQ